MFFKRKQQLAYVEMCQTGLLNNSFGAHFWEFASGPKFYYLPLPVMLDFQPLSTLKQKPRNRLDVENGMRLVLTNMSPMHEFQN